MILPCRVGHGSIIHHGQATRQQQAVSPVRPLYPMPRASRSASGSRQGTRICSILLRPCPMACMTGYWPVKTWPVCWPQKDMTTSSFCRVMPVMWTVPQLNRHCPKPCYGYGRTINLKENEVRASGLVPVLLRERPDDASCRSCNCVWSEAGLRHIRLYTNKAITENISLYQRIRYAETHRAEEKGLQRVYMVKILPERPCSL